MWWIFVFYRRMVIDVHIRDSRCYFLLTMIGYNRVYMAMSTLFSVQLYTHSIQYTCARAHIHIVEHLFISNLHQIWLAWDLWKPIQYVNSGVSECTRRGCDHCSLLFIFSFKILPQYMKLRCIFISTTVNVQYCCASICVQNISRCNMYQINQLS